MSDPTYVKEEIDANPTWKLAWVLSEIDNDAAPIGWGRYIFVAKCLQHFYTLTEKPKEPYHGN